MDMVDIRLSCDSLNKLATNYLMYLCEIRIGFGCVVFFLWMMICNFAIYIFYLYLNISNKYLFSIVLVMINNLSTRTYFL